MTGERESVPLSVEVKDEHVGLKPRSHRNSLTHLLLVSGDQHYRLVRFLQPLLARVRDTASISCECRSAFLKGHDQTRVALSASRLISR
jgi:hypothetical protein